MQQELPSENNLLFQFPVGRDNYEQLHWPEIRQFIARERQIYNIQCSYRFVLTRKKYLYVRCSKCPSQLKFRLREDNSLQLMSFHNKHNHQTISEKQQHLRKIKNFINELPTTIQTSSAKKIVMKNFGIKQAKFYYLFNQIRNPATTLKQTIKRLIKQGYQIVTEPFQIKDGQQPDFIIAISPVMKFYFEKYGQWVTFDLTYNMITSKSYNDKKYGVGCFVGLSNCKHIVPFGLVITNSEKKQTYYSIFKSFFDIMEDFPQTLITDEALAIKGAVQDLTKDGYFPGNHLLDCFHILKNVKKNLKQKHLLKQMKILVHCRTKNQYNLHLKKCYQLFEDNDIQALKKFDRNRHLYCFSHIPETMVGFSVSDSINQKTNDLMKTVLPRSKPIQVVLSKILKFLQQLASKAQNGKIEKLKVQNIFGCPQIKQIRCLLHEKVFGQFTKELGKVNCLEIMHIQRDNSMAIILDNQKSQFNLKKLQQWECDCGYREKTGLLCSHLIKICFAQKESMTKYIHTRWHIYQEKKIVKLRGRKTRRNLIK